MRYAKLNAPKKLQNTSQTFMSNVWVVGNGLGSFFWTFCYDYFNSFRICYLSGVFILLCLSYYTFYFWNIIDDDEKKDNVNSDADAKQYGNSSSNINVNSNSTDMKVELRRRN